MEDCVNGYAKCESTKIPKAKVPNGKNLKLCSIVAWASLPLVVGLKIQWSQIESYHVIITKTTRNPPPPLGKIVSPKRVYQNLASTCLSNSKKFFLI